MMLAMTCDVRSEKEAAYQLVQVCQRLHARVYDAAGNTGFVNLAPVCLQILVQITPCKSYLVC